MKDLEIIDVKTKADVHRILAQKCIFTGYSIAIATFVFGVVALPFAFNRSKILAHFQKEYRTLVGVFISVGVSYSSAVYCKNRCQTSIIKELKELNLGHLVEGIEGVE